MSEPCSNRVHIIFNHASVVTSVVSVLLTSLRTKAFVYVSWSYIVSNITYQSRFMVVSAWVPVLLTPLRTKAFVYVSWSYLHGDNPITHQSFCLCVLVVYRIKYYVPITRHGRIYMGAYAVNPITYRACVMVVSTWVPVPLTPLRTNHAFHF